MLGRNNLLYASNELAGLFGTGLKGNRSMKNITAALRCDALTFHGLKGIVFAVVVLVLGFSDGSANAGDFQSGLEIAWQNKTGQVVCCGMYGVRKFSNVGAHALTKADKRRWESDPKDLSESDSVLHDRADAFCYFFGHSIKEGATAVITKVNTDTCQTVWEVDTAIDLEWATLIATSISGEVLSLFTIVESTESRAFAFHVYEFSAKSGKRIRNYVIESKLLFVSEDQSPFFYVSFTDGGEKLLIRNVSYYRDEMRREHNQVYAYKLVYIQGNWQLAAVQRFDDVFDVLQLPDGKWIAFSYLPSTEPKLEVLDTNGTLLPWKTPVEPILSQFGHTTWLKYGSGDTIWLAENPTEDYSGCLSFDVRFSGDVPKFHIDTPLSESHTRDSNDVYLFAWGEMLVIDKRVYRLAYDGQEYQLERLVKVNLDD